MPDVLETVMKALARLSMANDSDRLAERMISMLPKTILDTSCWYSDNDEFEANLWDIEPEVQVAGITESGSLVLDGCRAAIIRWKDFPKALSTTKGSIRRGSAKFLAWTGPFLFIIGCFLASTPSIGAPTIIFGLLILCGAPWLNVYANSGRVLSVEPWLVGVEGVMSAADAELHVYGSRPYGHLHAKLRESPTGSPFATPVRSGKLRKGETAYQRAKDFERQSERNHTGLKIFTLIDTISSTVYYFSAKCPPTVCVFVGREGGLGRFVLCSEHCNRNELHKETVLRMPTYISERMALCDWLAIGRISTRHTLRGQIVAQTGNTEMVARGNLAIEEAIQ
jgi:hypothetical protein